MFYLKQYEEQIYGCTMLRCGNCGPSCPGFTAEGLESNTPRGKMEIARGVLEGTLELTDALVERVYFCVQCGACVHRCAFAPLYVVDALKAEIFKAGRAPRQVYNMSESLKEHNVCFQPHEKRLECLSAEARIPREAEVLLFLSCNPAYKAPSSVQATATLLDNAGVKWTTLGGEEWCCGLPLVQCGMAEKAKEYFEHNVHAINRAAKDLGVKTLIASCGACATGFKMYPARYGMTLNVEVLHISEFFHRLVREDRIRFREWKATVAYHDACQLRWQGIFDAPRECLKAIPGLQLVEITPNRDLSSCCGHIPWFSDWFTVSGMRPDVRLLGLLRTITRKRVREIEETGADTVVVSCRGCLRMSGLLQGKQSGIKVMMLSDALEANLQ